MAPSTPLLHPPLCLHRLNKTKRPPPPPVAKTVTGPAQLISRREDRRTCLKAELFSDNVSVCFTSREPSLRVLGLDMNMSSQDLFVLVGDNAMSEGEALVRYSWEKRFVRYAEALR